MKKQSLAILLCGLLATTMTGCGLAATQAPADSGTADSGTSDTAESGTASSETAAITYSNTSETQGKTNEIVVKVSNGAGETSPGVKAQLSTFAPEVETNSNGRIGVEVYAGAQLGDDTTATEMVASGQLEINNTSTAPLVGYVPELGIFDIPFLFNDEEEADAIIDSEVGDYLNEKLEAKGIINLAWNENGFRELTNSKRTVASVDDVAGLKIRTMENKFHQELWNSLGATATPMSSGELYTALEQGTVDGEENPIANFYSYQFQEVQDYITMTNHIYSPFLFDMSKIIWDTYDQETQDVLSAAAQKYGPEERRINREAAAEDLQSCIDDYGIEVTYLDDDAKQAFLDKTSHIQDLIAQDTGTEIMDLLNQAKADYAAK